MRRGGSTILLIVVAAALGAYLYFVDAKKPVADETAKKKVFSLDAGKIEQMQIKSDSGDVTVLKKDAKGWNVVTPINGTADQNNATDVATNLATLEENRLVEENAADLKPFGLANPRIDITFNVAGEKEPKRILFGDLSPTNVGLYAKLANDNRVFLVPTSVNTSVNRSTFDLRDKTALKFETLAVDSIELVSKSQSIRLVKSGQDWKLVKPVDAPADLTSVEGLIGQIQSAQMMALKDKAEDVKDLKQYGLDKPEVTATFGMGSSHVSLELGFKADTVTFWARDPAKPMIFSIGNGLAEELRKTPFDLRRKEVFEFRPFEAARFEITRGKETRAFESAKGATPGAADTWKQTVPAVKTVDASNFAGALLEIANLRAQAFVDKAGPTTGLSNPVAIITVTFENKGKKEERVTFGRAGPDVFAARPDQPGALKLETGKFDDAIKNLDEIK
jgi:hypothetical protein